MQEEDLYFVESSQDDEIEMQIPFSEASLHSPPYHDTNTNTFRPESQDAATEHHPHESDGTVTQSSQSWIPYGHHCHSQDATFSTGYDGDFERPTPSPPSLGHRKLEASTYEIFKILKSDYKATCEECDIPYESQPTLPESLLQNYYEHEEESQSEPPAQLLSQVNQTEQPEDSDQEVDSELANQNLAKVDKATRLKTNNIRSPTFAPISSSSTRSPSRHRAATHARRAAREIKTLEGFLMRERRRYKRLMSIVLGTQ